MSDNLKHRTEFTAQHINNKTTNSVPKSSSQTTQLTLGHMSGHISAARNDPGISTTQTPHGESGLRWDETKLDLT